MMRQVTVQVGAAVIRVELDPDDDGSSPVVLVKHIPGGQWRPARESDVHHRLITDEERTLY